MTTLNVFEAQSRLYQLIDDATLGHPPVTISGRNGNAILLSEEQWQSLLRTQESISLDNLMHASDSNSEWLLSTQIDDNSEYDWYWS